MTKRHLYGIDYARIAAIFLVILQHLTISGVDSAGHPFLYRISARLMEALAQPCVDLFALISGYVCLTATWRPMRYFKLWLQVVFTAAVIVAVVPLVAAAPVSRDWLKVLTPVCHDTYWYFTGYTVVFLLMPVLNRLMRLKWACTGAFALVAVLAILQTLGVLSAFTFLNDGYSAAWLVVLYAVGAGLRQIEDRLPRTPWPYFVLAFACVLLTMAQRLFTGYDDWTLFKYTSPTNVVAAASLLVGFLRLPSPDFGGTAIRALSSAAFGVYLWHVHPLFFRQCWFGSFTFFNDIPGWAYAAAMLGTAGLAFLLIAAVELLRIRLFSCIGRCVGKVLALT